jgi:transposase
MMIRIGGRTYEQESVLAERRAVARIKSLLPTDARGVARVDDRRVISGIIHVLKSGCRWCDCPEVYGPHTTIYNRFVRWTRRWHLGKPIS